MSKKFRRFLSVLLAAAMMLSNVQLSHAAESSKASDAAGSQAEGRELEMKEIDPATLGIRKLGEEADQEEIEEAAMPFKLDDIVRVSIFLEEPGAYDAGYDLQNISANKSAVSYQESLRRSQASMKSRIEAATGRAIEVKWNPAHERHFSERALRRYRHDREDQRREERGT